MKVQKRLIHWALRTLCKDAVVPQLPFPSRLMDWTWLAGDVAKTVQIAVWLGFLVEPAGAKILAPIFTMGWVTSAHCSASVVRSDFQNCRLTARWLEHGLPIWFTGWESGPRSG